MVEAILEPFYKAKYLLFYLNKYNKESKIVYLTFKVYLYTKLQIDIAAIKGKFKQV